MPVAVLPSHRAGSRPRTRVVAGVLAAGCVLGLGWAAPASAAAAPGGPAAAAGSLPVGFDTPALRELRERSARTQEELTRGLTAYEAAARQLEAARATAERTRLEAEAAQLRVEDMKGRVGAYAAAAYRGAIPSDLSLVLGAASGGCPGDALVGVEYVERVRRGQNVDLDSLEEAQRLAAELSARAKVELAAADEQQRRLALEADRLRRLAAQAAADLSAQLTAASEALEASAAEQRALGQDAGERWRAYLDRLRIAKITPPRAAALDDPARLPAGMRPVVTAGVPSRGVAEVTDPAGQPLVVLSAETIQAVSAALTKVGKRYADGASGPDAYDCGGLTASSWRAALVTLPRTPAEQFSVLAPVAPAAVQPGDVVFLGDRSLGLYQVGISLGAGAMLAASRSGEAVRVEPLPGGLVLGAARPTLGRRAAVPAPKAPAGGVSASCGGWSVTPGSGGGGTGWGGHRNGLIPPSALCEIGIGGHRLRCDAALAFKAMSASYATAFGGPICLTDSYRSLEEQVAVFIEKPGLAAQPGTSNHGWGLAVDLCGGAETAGTEQDVWLHANAGRFGWVHPAWAEPGGSRPEAWHWEFGAL